MEPFVASTIPDSWHRTYPNTAKGAPSAQIYTAAEAATLVVRQTRISEIVRSKRAITTDTALRLSKALGMDDRLWINIQTDYDLEAQRDLHSAELANVVILVAS